MILWSILTVQAWKELQRKGRLHANRRHVTKDFLDPYLWMAEQMQRRLEVPRPSKDAMPIWAWHRWQGKRCKPDLRACGHLPKGERGVRLELQVADDRVLLSDFDLWHYVLNYWYLPATEKAGEAFEEKLTRLGLSCHKCDHRHPLSHAEYRRQVEESWERIFDVEWVDRQHAIAQRPEKKSIQATLWELFRYDVADAREFVAK